MAMIWIRKILGFIKSESTLKTVLQNGFRPRLYNLETIGLPSPLT